MLPALTVISDIVPKSVPSVPVPPVPSILTVTSSKVATDNVAVTVTVLVEFSSIADAININNIRKGEVIPIDYMDIRKNISLEIFRGKAILFTMR